jgi:hypothetical protein
MVHSVSNRCHTPMGPTSGAGPPRPWTALVTSRRPAELVPPGDRPRPGRGPGGAGGIQRAGMGPFGNLPLRTGDAAREMGETDGTGEDPYRRFLDIPALGLRFGDLYASRKDSALARLGGWPTRPVAQPPPAVQKLPGMRISQSLGITRLMLRAS